MQYTDIQTALMVLMGACTFVIAIGGAAAVITKVYTWATKPTADQGAEIKEIKECLHDDKLQIKNIWREIEEIKKGNDERDTYMRLMMSALMQILGNIAGNDNIDAIKDAHDKIERFLIEK